jgi:hypothetical protein
MFSVSNSCTNVQYKHQSLEVSDGSLHINDIYIITDLPKTNITCIGEDHSYKHIDRLPYDKL